MNLKQFFWIAIVLLVCLLSTAAGAIQ